MAYECRPRASGLYNKYKNISWHNECLSLLID
jgi:hypothetical protein